jgi:hypothetical protein
MASPQGTQQVAATTNKQPAVNPNDSIDSITKNIFEAMKNIESSPTNDIFFGLVVVGFIIYGLGLSVSSDDGSMGSASGVLWGFMLVVFSLIGIIFINIDTGANEWRAIQSLPLPLVLTVILLIWVISLNIKYFTQINKRTVPDSYFTWSMYSSIVIACMVGISMFQYLLSKSKNTSTAINFKNVAVYSYLLIFLTFITVIIQQIILDCFTVDG